MRSLLCSAVLFTSVYSQGTTSQPQIHGRAVSAECLTAYKAQFVPEHQRVEALVHLSSLVATPPELKDRAQKAAQAMTSYQAVLDIIDAKLADSLTMEDKTNLETAANAQTDVGPTLTEIGKIVTAPDYAGSADMKAAYQSFRQAREVEIKAAAVVDHACPDDLE